MWIPDKDPNFKDLALPGPIPDPATNTRGYPKALKVPIFHKKIYNLE